MAWKEAKINPESISYIEAHGTGTLLGDPIETKAISSAINKFTDRKQFCAIGSVKSNIGHAVAASGLAGITKVVLALRNKAIPATVNFSQPNPFIHFADSPLYVNDSLTSWEGAGQPRRAGISSFGFSGTNCHVVLEEAPVIGTSISEKGEPAPDIMTISAKNDKSLQAILQRYVQFIDQGLKCSIKDLCFTANGGRGHYSHRLAFVFTGEEEFVEKIMLLSNGGMKEYREIGVYYGSSDHFLEYNNVKPKCRKGNRTNATTIGCQSC